MAKQIFIINEQQKRLLDEHEANVERIAKSLETDYANWRRRGFGDDEIFSEISTEIGFGFDETFDVGEIMANHMDELASAVKRKLDADYNPPTGTGVTSRATAGKYHKVYFET